MTVICCAKCWETTFCGDCGKRLRIALSELVLHCRKNAESRRRYKEHAEREVAKAKKEGRQTHVEEGRVRTHQENLNKWTGWADQLEQLLEEKPK